MNREQNSYPAQLQAYLGAAYEVRNFGVNARTLLEKGDHPYVETAEYADSHAWQPDIVLIKLGTNDTKPQNWCHEALFSADYQRLIDSYRQLSSSPRVILLTPVRCFLQETGTISPSLIEQQVRPRVEELAWQNRLEILNLFSLFTDPWTDYLMPDRLHPSSIGAGMMARQIGDYLLRTQEVEPTKPLFEQPGFPEFQPFSFHGYAAADFTWEGLQGKIVAPYREATGRPWVLRARFWGHEPQTDIALLEAGFHIAYCDVADLYGAPEAVARWDRFYQWMVGQGFQTKVVLEGMSRGGLIVYNWAAAHPDRVACIYADAPVMDFKSWPLGEGKGCGSEQDVQQLCRAYGFQDVVEAKAYRGNPIDQAAIIARAAIPCLHVVGDADEVVPVEENTTPFAEQMARLGHPIEVIHKPGVGHHPHSLANPEPIVRFVLNATGRWTNECVHARPGNEYRSAAGWTQGSEWHAVAKDIETTLEGRQLKLLLLGNSIIQGFGGDRAAVTYKAGKEAMDHWFGASTWESAGISGDRTQNLLWRVQQGGYNRCSPERVVIAIGINNIIAGNAAHDVYEGIVAVAEAAEQEFPQADILLLGLLPSGETLDHPRRRACDQIHTWLAAYPFKRAHYVNPTSWFVDVAGKAKEGLFSPDYIHLTPAGYQVFAQELFHYVEKP